jgi:hypothetical protein
MTPHFPRAPQLQLLSGDDLLTVFDDFESTCATDMEVMFQILNDAAKPLRSVHDNIHSELLFHWLQIRQPALI